MYSFCRSYICIHFNLWIICYFEIIKVEEFNYANLIMYGFHKKLQKDTDTPPPPELNRREKLLITFVSGHSASFCVFVREKISR